MLTPQAWPDEMYEELAHANWAKHVIEICAGSGGMARMSLKRQLSYVGICTSEKQKQVLEEMLADYMLTLMADTNSLFYNSDYVETKGKKFILEDVEMDDSGKKEVLDESKGVVPGKEGDPTKKPAPPGGALAAMLAEARARMEGNRK